jgi:hypothetical protein
MSFHSFELEIILGISMENLSDRILRRVIFLLKLILLKTPCEEEQGLFNEYF